MHLLQHDSDQLRDLDLELKQSVRELIVGIPPAAEDFVKVEGDQLFFDPVSEHIYYLEEGEIHLEMEGQTLLSYDAGDIIGLIRPINTAAMTLTCASKVKLIPLHRNNTIEYVCKTRTGQLLWSQYLSNLASIFMEMMSHLPVQRPVNKGFMHLEAGQTIINQGDTSDYVYTMMEGSADVFKDGVKVGEIHAQEIFGAMASFIGKERSATVVARERCLVIAVPESEFQTLIAEQPELSYTLLKTMAGTIKTLNQLLSEKEKA